MKALEADDASAKTASVTKKTNLRNASSKCITSASSITALKRMGQIYWLVHTHKEQ